MIFEQIFDMVNIGIVVLDSDLKVRHWNRWMALQSGIPAELIVGEDLFVFFPNLNSPRFLRSCKAVLTFGNFSFFSQKLHRYLFPFKAVSSYGARFQHMQQSCTMGPIRDEDNDIKYLYITVQDVTEVVAYEQRLLEKNMQDGLTGVYNRRFLEEYLSREFEKYKRYSRDMSLIMLDIDFFKSINDMYGHLCGDHILRCISDETLSVIRKVDVLARYGGEEFCCLLPETNLSDALNVAERIRTTIGNRIYCFQEYQIRVTVSLGVSVLRDDVESAEKLLELADEALYEAKRSGRNRSVTVQKINVLPD